MTLALNSIDAFIRYTPLVALMVGLFGVIRVAREKESEAQRVDWLGIVLLGVGAILELIVFYWQNIYTIHIGRFDLRSAFFGYGPLLAFIVAVVGAALVARNVKEPEAKWLGIVLLALGLAGELGVLGWAAVLR